MELKVQDKKSNDGKKREGKRKTESNFPATVMLSPNNPLQNKHLGNFSFTATAKQDKLYLTIIFLNVAHNLSSVRQPDYYHAPKGNNGTNF